MPHSELFDIRLMHYGREAHVNGYVVASWDEKAQDYRVVDRQPYGQALCSEEERAVSRAMALAGLMRLAEEDGVPCECSRLKTEQFGAPYYGPEDMVEDYRLANCEEEDGKREFRIGKLDAGSWKFAKVASFPYKKEEQWEEFEARTQAFAWLLAKAI